MRFVCLSQINPHLKNWPQIPVTEGLILLRDGSEWSGKWSKEKLHGPQLMQQINSPCRRAKSFRSLSRLPVHPLKLTWTGIRRFIKEKKPLGMLMGTVGCQGILSKAPWKRQGLSRLEYIWGNPRLSGTGVCVFTWHGLGPFHADDHRIITTVFSQDGEKIIEATVSF